MQNYMVFNDVEGVYTYTFEYERKVIKSNSFTFLVLLKEDCPACSTRPIPLSFNEDATLKELFDYLCESEQL